MEIIIRFNSSIWGIGRYGFRRVQTMDWDKLEVAFEHLFEIQHKEVLEKQDNLGKAVNEFLETEEKKFEIIYAGGWRHPDDNARPFPNSECVNDPS